MFGLSASYAKIDGDAGSGGTDGSTALTPADGSSGEYRRRNHYSEKLAIARKPGGRGNRKMREDHENTRSVLSHGTRQGRETGQKGCFPSGVALASLGPRYALHPEHPDALAGSRSTLFLCLRYCFFPRHPKPYVQRSDTFNPKITPFPVVEFLAPSALSIRTNFAATGPNLIC